MIDEGTVAESGTHDELMQHDGIYRRLFLIQARDYQQAVGSGVEDEGMHSRTTKTVS